MNQPRPSAAELLPLVFAEAPTRRGGLSYRLRPEMRAQVIAELRCPRKRHLVALALRTAHGPWVAWRRPTGKGGFDLSGGWECAWYSRWSSLMENAGCTCRTRRDDGVTTRRVWIVPMYWLIEQHGVVLARVERKDAVK